MRAVAVLAASVAPLLLFAVWPSPAAAQSAAALSGKPVAPFTLAAEAVATPTLGVPVDVRITVETRAALEDIEVRVAADEGLSVDVGDYTLYAPSATPEMPAEWLIRVVPVMEGTQRLRLFGEALVGGTRQGRSAVATLRVGAEGRGSDSSVRGADSGAQGASIESSQDAQRTGEGSRSQQRAAEPGGDGVVRLPASVRP